MPVSERSYVAWWADCETGEIRVAKPTIVNPIVCWKSLGFFDSAKYAGIVSDLRRRLGLSSPNAP